MAAAVNDDRIFNEERNQKAYEKVDHLGTGSFGDVYEVIRISDKSAFAVKKVERSKRNVEKEGVILRELQHPYILKYYEVIHEDGNIYFLMELCKNGNLEVYIESKYKSKKNSIPEEKVIRWMTQIALGLEFLHSTRLIHRDIKLENILISDEDDCKLADFGLLRFEDGVATSTIGTPLYLPPEESFSSARDMWALGIVVHYLCTYEYPFYSMNYEDPPPRINTDTKKYSAKLQEIIDGLLSLEKSSRWSAMKLLQTTYVQLPESIKSTIPSPQLERIENNKDLVPHEINQPLKDLFLSTVQNGQNEIVETLLQHSSALVHCVDKQSNSTALTLAGANEHWNTVKILLKHGATVNKNDQSLKDVFLLAAQNGQNELIEELLKACGDLVNIPDNNGSTPLQLAVNKQDWTFMKILLKYNATIDGFVYERKLMEHALLDAAVNGKLEIFEIILQIFPQLINMKYDSWGGATVLHVASLNGHLNIVEKILQTSRFIHEKDNSGLSPLHCAALGGHLNIVKYLLMSGADPHQRDNDSTTAGDLAVQLNRREVAQKLKKSKMRR